MRNREITQILADSRAFLRAAESSQAQHNARQFILESLLQSLEQVFARKSKTRCHLLEQTRMRLTNHRRDSARVQFLNQARTMLWQASRIILRAKFVNKHPLTWDYQLWSRQKSAARISNYSNLRWAASDQRERARIGSRQLPLCAAKIRRSARFGPSGRRQKVRP